MSSGIRICVCGWPQGGFAHLRALCGLLLFGLPVPRAAEVCVLLEKRRLMGRRTGPFIKEQGAGLPWGRGL